KLGAITDAARFHAGAGASRVRTITDDTTVDHDRRLDEARRLLAIVQLQMVFRPVERVHPATKEANGLATGVGSAIRWLDMGANGQATQALDQATYNAGSDWGRR